MLRKVRKQIRRLDTFGAEVKFNLCHRPTHQSTLGGVTTLCLSCVIAIVMITSSLSLLQKETYTIQSNQVVNIDPPLDLLNYQKFMLGLQVDQSPFAKRLYAFSIQQMVQRTLPNGTRIRTEGERVALEPCTEHHFIQFDKSSSYGAILQSQLSSYFCLPLNYTLQIQGIYRSDWFQYGKLSVEYCSESDCYTHEERAQLLADRTLPVELQISTIMLNSIINMRSEQSIQHYIYSDLYFRTAANSSQVLKTDLFLERQNIKVDNSIVSGLPDLDLKELYKLDEAKVKTLAEGKKEPKQIVDIYIRVSQSEAFYDKSFYRFDQLFSYIGGITKFLMSFIGYFIMQYNQTGLQIQLANQLYQFDMPEKKKGEVVFSFQSLVSQIIESLKQMEDVATKFKNGAHKVMQIAKLAHAFKGNPFATVNQTVISSVGNRNTDAQHLQTYSETQREPMFQHLQQDEIMKHMHAESNQTINLELCKKSFLERVINIILSSQQKLHYGVHIVFSNVAKKLKKKDDMSHYKAELFRQSQRMIQRDMDLLVIMNKLQEVGKLKHVMLNKTQRQVFNYLPKPVISINQEHPDMDGSHHASIFAYDIDGKKDNMLLKQRKSLLGTRHQFNTSEKLRKLYEAYEDIKIKKPEEERSIIESQINERLIQLMEPTLQHSFESLSDLERLSRQIKERQPIARQKVIGMTLRKNDTLELNEEQNSSVGFKRYRKDLIYSKPSLVHLNGAGKVQSKNIFDEDIDSN